MDNYGNNPKPFSPATGPKVDKAADTVKSVAASGQQAADRSLDKASDQVDDLKAKAAPVIDRATDAAHSAVDLARDKLTATSDQLRDQAQKATDYAVSYAKDEPVKAMLVAAGVGAVLMALITR